MIPKFYLIIRFNCLLYCLEPFFKKIKYVVGNENFGNLVNADLFAIEQSAQASVVQRLESAIQRINHYLMCKYY